MKTNSKLLIIIIILGIIAFCVYKFLVQPNTTNNNAPQDFSDLEKYVEDIYGRTFLIPEFDDINDADENWLWENVNQYVWNRDDEFHEQNRQEYGYSYNDISKIVKILYGDNLNKSFPKGAVAMRYNSYNELYGPSSFDVTNYYNYEIDNISQNGNIYTISLYDYTISTFFALGDNTSEDDDYVIFNNYDYLLNNDEGTPIISVSSLKDEKFQNLLEQKDKLSHKILTIEYDENTNLYHIISCKYKETKPEETLASIYNKMQSTFEIMSINYNYDDIYTQDEVLVNNFDELSSIYTENSIDTYKKEMDLFVYKDNGEVYITAGDITVGDYLQKIKFENIENSKNKISCNVIRTFRESFDANDEGYNKTYQKEDKFTIVKTDGQWFVDEFSYNNL